MTSLLQTNFPAKSRTLSTTFRRGSRHPLTLRFTGTRYDWDHYKRLLAKAKVLRILVVWLAEVYLPA